MPLDFTSKLDIPDYIDFNISLEPTEVSHRKLVRNADTGKAIEIVGVKQTVIPNGIFYQSIYDTMTEVLEPWEMKDAKFKWKTGRNGGFSMMDVILPHRIERIPTPKHETVINPRWLAFTSVDGKTSANCLLGTFDQFCFNGQVNGEHNKVTGKHSSNYTNESFIIKLQQAEKDFFLQTKKLQKMADTNTQYVDVKSLLEKIMSKRYAEKMYSLYNEEASTRGYNAFALYSAFTNYSTYADERNGFNIKNTSTKQDTESITMLDRERKEVNKWVSTPQFKELVAA